MSKRLLVRRYNLLWALLVLPRPRLILLALPSLHPSETGYAFVEYDNPDTALTAIQNLGNVEVDGRRLRVGFSNNSGLEAIAKQRGLTITPNGGVTGKNLEEVLANFPLPDMYDMIAHLKEVAETKPEELRLLLISHPQIAEAIVHMQVKIGMIRPLTRASDQQPYQQQQQQQQQLPQPLQLQPPVHLGAFGQQQKQQQQQQQPHVGGLAAAGGFYQAQPPPLFPSQQVGGWSGQMPPLPPPVPFDPSAGAGLGSPGPRGGLERVGGLKKTVPVRRSRAAGKNEVLWKDEVEGRVD
eukprot:evm.model.NODE_12998_length_13939_cov_25.947701.2